MIIKRFIHSVGQGAFYSEHFDLESEPRVNIVYDCGTKDQWRGALESSCNFCWNLSEGVIDALFISHFDQDHVNGIFYLVQKLHVKIKKVVLPVMRNEYWLQITEFGVKYYNSYNTLISLFNQNNIPIVEVLPVEGNENTIPENQREAIEVQNLSGRIPSGTPIKVAKYEDLKWVYIPIYFDALLKLKDDLKDKLEDIPYNGRTLEVDKDLQNIGSLPQDVISKINDVYKEIVSDNNRPSMLCYSGPIEKINVQNYKKYSHYFRYFWSRINLKENDQGVLGTLYTGDSSLKRELCKEIASILKIKDKKDKKTYDLVPLIGALQLPHHGSGNNITLKSVEKYMKLCSYGLTTFASFGLGNSYGHPSASLIETILQSYGRFFEVNEMGYSSLSDEIRLYK